MINDSQFWITDSALFSIGSCMYEIVGAVKSVLIHTKLSVKVNIFDPWSRFTLRHQVRFWGRAIEVDVAASGPPQDHLKIPSAMGPWTGSSMAMWVLFNWFTWQLELNVSIKGMTTPIPWMVELEVRPGGHRQHQCGGTLINPGWVLSAFHCVLNEQTWVQQFFSYSWKNKRQIIRYLRFCRKRRLAPNELYMWFSQVWLENPPYDTGAFYRRTKRHVSV